jgi:hypothetical protein
VTKNEGIVIKKDLSEIKTKQRGKYFIIFTEIFGLPETWSAWEREGTVTMVQF